MQNIIKNLEKQREAIAVQHLECKNDAKVIHLKKAYLLIGNAVEHLEDIKNL